MGLLKRLENISAAYSNRKLTEDEIKEADAKIVSAFDEYLHGWHVRSNNGVGEVLGVSGDSIADASVDVYIRNTKVKLSLSAVINGPSTLVRFYDRRITTCFAMACNLSNMLKTNNASAKADARAVRGFKAALARTRDKRDSEDFYFALGWLVSNMATLNAGVTENLEKAFVEHFGTEVTYKLLETKKGTAKYAFKLMLKKYTDTPEFLTAYVNGKEINDLELLLELLTNYGFRLGKQQDKEAIEKCVPEQFKEFYQLGLSTIS